MANPTKLIILISGKRKSGKDYLAECLVKRLGPAQAEIIRISEPIKSHWASVKGLDLQQLLSDGPYKEQHRKDMIEWSDGVRHDTPGFFCQEAYAKATKPVVVVSDIRRRTDIEYFRTLPDKNCIIKSVRLSASDTVRTERGWKFQTGVDDVASECDLDAVADWDYRLANETGTCPDALLAELMQLIIPLLEEETQL